MHSSVIYNIWKTELFINTHIQVFWSTCFAAVSWCSFSHFSCSNFRFTLYSLRSVNSWSHLARAWVKAASTYKQIKKKKNNLLQSPPLNTFLLLLSWKEQTSVWITYIYRNQKNQTSSTSCIS